MKKEEFESKLSSLLSQSIDLEKKASLTMVSTIFFTNQVDKLVLKMEDESLTKKQKKEIEKKINTLLKKMEWELKENYKLEEISNKLRNTADELIAKKNEEGLE